MPKPIILYYEILHYRPENLALLHTHFKVIQLPDPSHDTLPLLRDATVILAPLGYYLGKDKIDQCRNLKVIASNTTGHPHIDVPYASLKGIEVITLKDYREFLDSITPTTELTWGLIIAVTRNLVPAFQSVLEGRWERWPFGGKKMLSRMSLGVVGLGRLGKKVAHYGVCFGMTVRFFDPYVPSAPHGVEKVGTLRQLVETSDIVTVHVLHTPETERMFNAEVFSHFKDGSFFINTSRGELVDHEALLACLKSGKLAGAGVDVLDHEFVPGFQEQVLEQPLVQYARTHSNVIITPHIGGSTEDAWTLTQEFTVERVIDFLQLRHPPTEKG